MRKTSPGVDRIETVAMRRNVAGVKAAMDQHVTLCYRCKHAGSDVYSHCDEWWRMARQLHRARRILARLESPATEGELTLPGMDDL